jgi:Putative zinc-finger
MSSLSCAEVQEAATEYALGLLEPHEAQEVAAHVLGCPECRQEVDDIRLIGDRLLELVPGTEPPLGFDKRVLKRIVPRRPGRRIRRLYAGVITGAAAAVAAAALLAATLGAPGHRPRPAELAAAFRAGGRDIGSVYISGNPAWISMSVHQATLTGWVTCQLIEAGGKTATIGTFQLQSGRGTWEAPEPAGDTDPAGARLLGPSGNVIATAYFHAG